VPTEPQGAPTRPASPDRPQSSTKPLKHQGQGPAEKPAGRPNSLDRPRSSASPGLYGVSLRPVAEAQGTRSTSL